MSVKNVPQPKYRIEERGWPNGNVPTLEVDGRDDAMQVFDGICRAARPLYAARPNLRLVLIGPDHKVQPGGDPC